MSLQQRPYWYAAPSKLALHLTPPLCRRTRHRAATVLDAAGHSGREIADQLGHSKPSMTQDVYLGRKAANPEAAKALEQLLREVSDHATESEKDG